MNPEEVLQAVRKLVYEAKHVTVGASGLKLELMNDGFLVSSGAENYVQIYEFQGTVFFRCRYTDELGTPIIDSSMVTPNFQREALVLYNQVVDQLLAS